MQQVKHIMFLSKKLELEDFEDGKNIFTTCGKAVLADCGFYRRGKKTAWEAWESFLNAPLAFLHMQNYAYTSLNVPSDYLL